MKVKKYQIFAVGPEAVLQEQFFDKVRFGCKHIAILSASASERNLYARIWLYQNNKTDRDEVWHTILISLNLFVAVRW